MKNIFFVPAVTFLTASIVWLSIFIAYLMSTSVQEWALWVKIILYLGVGCILHVSAVSCLKAGGPRVVVTSK